MKRVVLMLALGMAIGMGISSAAIYFGKAPQSLHEALMLALDRSPVPGGESAGSMTSEDSSVEALAAAADSLDGAFGEEVAPADGNDPLAPDHRTGEEGLLDLADRGASDAEALRRNGAQALPFTTSTAGAAPGAIRVGTLLARGESAADEHAGGGLAPDRLARLFGSMPARDAARVLEYMEDREVRMILGGLGNREAAAILSNLTPERAAGLSRSIIGTERSAP